MRKQRASRRGPASTRAVPRRRRKRLPRPTKEGRHVSMMLRWSPFPSTGKQARARGTNRVPNRDRASPPVVTGPHSPAATWTRACLHRRAQRRRGRKQSRLRAEDVGPGSSASILLVYFHEAVIQRLCYSTEHPRPVCNPRKPQKRLFFGPR
jgi:hypothetical protein